jgi:hypothetical protein
MRLIKAKGSFEDWVKDQTFPSENDPSKKVKFKSLSPKMQSKIRQSYMQKQKGDIKNVSSKANLKGKVELGGDYEVGDKANIGNSNIQNAKVQNATIQNANVLGGTWDKGQEIKGGTWSKDYDPSTIGFLNKHFEGQGDAPIRYVANAMNRSGNKEKKYKPGLLRSQEKIIKSIAEISKQDDSWVKKSKNSPVKSEHRLDGGKVLKSLRKMDKSLVNKENVKYVTSRTSFRGLYRVISRTKSFTPGCI